MGKQIRNTKNNKTPTTNTWGGGRKDQTPSEWIWKRKRNKSSLSEVPKVN